MPLARFSASQPRRIMKLRGHEVLLPATHVGSYPRPVYLQGKDPSKIEHHYQWLYRSSHFMGSVVQGALSAIDIALWDIKGKRLEVPIYDLMGGKTRDRVRCYMHVHGDTKEALAADAVKRAKQGFTAVRFSPFPRNYYQHKSYTEWADEAVERV